MGALLVHALLLLGADDVAPADDVADTVAPADDVAPPAPPAPEASASSQPAAPERIKLISLDLKGSNVAPEDLSLLSGLVAVELGAYRALEVVSGAEVRQLVELEGDKAMLGCETSTSCLAEIAGALGARLVAFGELGRLGKRYVLNLSLHDSKGNRNVGRASLQGDDIEGLADGMPDAAATLIEPFLQSEGLATERAGGTRIRAPRVTRDEAPEQGNLLRTAGGASAIVGAIGFAGLYGASAILPPSLGAPSFVSRRMEIPVAGPFLALSDLKSSSVDQNNFDPSGLFIGFGVGQAVFAALLVGGSTAWVSQVLAESPPEMSGAATGWRWGLVGGGAALVGGGVAIEALSDNARNHELDAFDIIAPVLYVAGGTAAVVGLATNPFIDGEDAR